MKKTLLFFSVGVLISILCVSCDDGDDRPPGMYPVPVNNEVTTLFNEHLQFFVSSIFSEFINAEMEMLASADSCVVINSANEFRRQIERQNDLLTGRPGYLSPDELPAIDFNTYTLVIGQCCVPSGGHALRSHYISTEDQKKVLNLNVERLSGANHSAEMRLPFWGVYPKLSEELIDINVIIK